MKRKKSWLLILGIAVLIGGGSVTAQAAPVKHIPDQSPVRHYAGPFTHKHMMGFEQTPQERQKLLSLLHIDNERFEREIRHGKSIAEIAVDRDVSVKAVIKLIERQIKDHIEQDKRDHRLTAKQASDMKKNARERATEIVYRNHR